jgi:predicted ATPase
MQNFTAALAQSSGLLRLQNATCARRKERNRERVGVVVPSGIMMNYDERRRKRSLDNNVWSMTASNHSSTE